MATDFNTDYPPSPYLGPTDQAGYDQSGWYPGKKRHWWEPVLKVASWNAWSPDDEKATRLNERIAAGRAGTGEEVNRTKAADATALDLMTQHFIKYGGMDQGTAAQKAAEVFATQHNADIAENRARGSKATVADKYAQGQQGGSFDEGAAATAANTARHNAGRSGALNLNSRYQAGMRLGLPEKEALTDLSANALADVQNQEGRLDVLDKGKQRDEAGATRAAVLPFARSVAENQARAADTLARDKASLVDGPGTARAINTAEINKGGVLPISYGSDAITPLPAGTNIIQNQHLAPIGTGTRDYTIETITDPLNPGNKKVIRRTDSGALPGVPPPPEGATNSLPVKRITMEDIARVLNGTNAPNVLAPTNTK